MSVKKAVGLTHCFKTRVFEVRSRRGSSRCVSSYVSFKLCSMLACTQTYAEACAVHCVVQRVGHEKQAHGKAVCGKCSDAWRMTTRKGASELLDGPCPLPAAHATHTRGAGTSDSTTGD